MGHLARPVRGALWVARLPLLVVVAELKAPIAIMDRDTDSDVEPLQEVLLHV